jgi:hypothetical protein
VIGREGLQVGELPADVRTFTVDGLRQVGELFEPGDALSRGQRVP